MKFAPRSGLSDFFRAMCKEHGLRVTPQRVAVYEELLRSGKHPTAERVHAMVRRRHPNVSLDTVNRTLLTFVRIGLVGIAEDRGGPRRYDANRAPHHHVHCVVCGAIEDFHNSEFDALKIPVDIRRKYRIIGKRVVAYGTCTKCRAKDDMTG